MFYKIGVLQKMFAEFTGKQLYRTPFLAGNLEVYNLIKKWTLQVFSCDFCTKFLRTAFLQNI